VGWDGRVPRHIQVAARHVRAHRELFGAANHLSSTPCQITPARAGPPDGQSPQTRRGAPKGRCLGCLAIRECLSTERVDRRLAGSACPSAQTKVLHLFPLIIMQNRDHLRPTVCSRVHPHAALREWAPSQAPKHSAVSLGIYSLPRLSPWSGRDRRLLAAPPRPF